MSINACNSTHPVVLRPIKECPEELIDRSNESEKTVDQLSNIKQYLDEEIRKIKLSIFVSLKDLSHKIDNHSLQMKNVDTLLCDMDNRIHDLYSKIGGDYK